jgi:hypothetical protein
MTNHEFDRPLAVVTQYHAAHLSVWLAPRSHFDPTSPPEA